MAMKKTAAPADRKRTAPERAPTRKVQRTPVSPLAAQMHETISDMHRLGFVDTRTMRRFDRTCLSEVERMSPQDIADLRTREGVSQSMFALHLNVTKSTVAQWEAGQKKPAGAALKLLNLVKGKGLKILA